MYIIIIMLEQCVRLFYNSFIHKNINVYMIVYILLFQMMNDTATDDGKNVNHCTLYSNNNI